MINPGSGDFPVGQFEAQNLLPNGKGIPSFASSVIEAGTKLNFDAWYHEPWFTRAAEKVWIKSSCATHFYSIPQLTEVITFYVQSSNRGHDTEYVGPTPIALS
jgi:hypothetical protein